MAPDWCSEVLWSANPVEVPVRLTFRDGDTVTLHLAPFVATYAVLYEYPMDPNIASAIILWSQVGLIDVWGSSGSAFAAEISLLDLDRSEDD